MLPPPNAGEAELCENSEEILREKSTVDMALAPMSIVSESLEQFRDTAKSWLGPIMLQDTTMFQ